MNMNSILKKEGTHYSPFAAFFTIRMLICYFSTDLCTK